MVSPEFIEDRDLTSDCLVTNTGGFGICDKEPAAVVYPGGVYAGKTWYGNLDEYDSRNGQDLILY